MNWFYAEGSNKNGPVSDSQLDELLRSGKISPATLVWREGMAEWQPLNVARPGGPSSVVCVECGKTLPREETIQFNNSSVCAQCKPIYLQRMAEGAAMPSVGGLWRSNKRLVARTETVFPDRCVKCNAPAGGFRLKRRLYWVHPAYFLLILCNLLVLLVVYLIVRKKAVVHIGLCERHRTKRKRGLIIAWSSVAVGIISMFYAGFMSSGWGILIGLIVLLGGGITGAVMARAVTPTKVDKEYVWLAGVNRDFMAGLPEWTGL
jgi:GYF domain 2